MIQLRTSPMTVALADPRWYGHHPTYFREFTTSLLRLGHRVIALCRKPDELASAVFECCESLGLDPGESLHIEQLDDPDRSFILPRRLDHDPLSTLARWRCLRRSLTSAESTSGWSAEFVFFPWLDSYLRFQPRKSLPSRVLGRPWGGLYFRNHHFAERPGPLKTFAKGDRGLRNADCRIIGVLDERFEGAMQSQSGRPTIAFPDITDETDPEELSPFAKELLRKADGRKVVGMVSLEKRKGFLTMLRIAEAVAFREDWYFVAAGPYCPETCSESEREFVENIAARAGKGGDLDNIHIDLEGSRIPDGAEFNSVIKSFDLIYAAYEGFQGSSNALTKAAVFRKPMVATRGECVGDRVEEFRLGLTFEEGDTEGGEGAIRRALAGIDWEGSPLVPRFEDYHALHNRERLDEVFAQILETV